MEPISIAKSAATFIKYFGAAGLAARDAYWAKLWASFFADMNDDDRERVVEYLCKDDGEGRFAAWLYGILIRAEDEATTRMLGKWALFIALGDRGPAYFYRGARGILDVHADDLQQLIAHATTGSELDDPEWEALLQGGFATRTIRIPPSPGETPFGGHRQFATRGQPQEAEVRYYLSDLGDDFLLAHGITPEEQ